MASAKQRYYANLAKKGKISKEKAAAYGVSEKDKPKKSSFSKTSSAGTNDPISAIRALNEKNKGNSNWSASDMALLRKYQSNEGLNKQALAYQSQQKRNIAESSDSSNKRKVASKSSSSVSSSKQAGPVKTNKYQHPTIEGADVIDPFEVRKKDTLTQGGRGDSFRGKVGDLFSSLFRSIGNTAGRVGMQRGSDYASMTPDEKSQERRDLAGIPTSAAAEDPYQSGLGKALDKAYQPDIPTGYGDSGQIYYNNYSPSGSKPRETAIPPQSTGNEGRSNFPIGGNVDKDTAERRRRAAEAQGANIGPWASGYGSQEEFGPRPDVEAPPVEIPTPAWENTGYTRATQSTPRVFGGGAFGTGKGVGNPADQDPYLKELRKSLKGYSSQEGEVRKQFEELIKALDPTYEQYKKEGQKALDEQQTTDLNRLASVMNAGNVGDSEQRAQMMQRTQGQYSDTLANLLQKLAVQKNQDIQGYKEKSVGAVNQVRGQAQQARERIAQLIRDYQDKQEEAAYRQQQDAYKRSSSYASSQASNQAKQQKALQALLSQAAQSPSGGREWASRMAPVYGLDSSMVSQYTPDNWESGFRGDQGSTIQELADELGLDYATAKSYYDLEYKNKLKEDLYNN